MEMLTDSKGVIVKLFIDHPCRVLYGRGVFACQKNIRHFHKDDEPIRLDRKARISCPGHEYVFYLPLVDFPIPRLRRLTKTVQSFVKVTQTPLVVPQKIFPLL